MKKIILILMLSLILIGCEISNDPYKKMTKLSKPEIVEIVSPFGFNGVEVKATHKFVMNDNETLYYVPEIVKYDGDTFINEKYGYIIKTVEDNKTTYTTIKESQAEKIVS